MAVLAIALLTALVSWLAWLVLGPPKRAPFAGVPMASPPKPLIGHAAALAERISGMYELCADGAADPETGLASLWLLNTPVLSVLDASDARKVLSASEQRDSLALFERHLGMFLGAESIVLKMGDPWKHTRTLLNRAFKPAHLVAMADDMSSVGARLIERIAAGGEQSFDAAAVLKKATIDVIGLCAFGFRFCAVETVGIEGAVPDPVAEAFGLLLAESDRRIFEAPFNPLNYFYWIPTARNRAHAAARARVRHALSAAVAEKRAAVASGSSVHDDLLAAMLEGDGGGGVPPSDAELIDNLITFFFAGFDTTSVAISWTLYELARHPDVQQRLHDEAIAVLGTARQPRHSDAAKLAYARAVFMEALRLYPPAPLTARNTTAPVRVGGFEVPVGTMVWLPVWWIHRSPRNFDDPGRFRPERFLRDGGAAQSNWLPFSAGRRSCVGARFAMLEGVILLAQLCRGFRFELAPGAPTVRPVSAGVVSLPKPGIQIIARPRL